MIARDSARGNRDCGQRGGAAGRPSRAPRPSKPCSSALRFRSTRSLRDRCPGGRCLGSRGAGVCGHWKAGAESSEALGRTSPTPTAARKPVGPGRRAGARLTADARRDRARAGPHRPALHRAASLAIRRANHFLGPSPAPAPSWTRWPRKRARRDGAIGTMADRTAALRTVSSGWPARSVSGLQSAKPRQRRPARDRGGNAESRSRMGARRRGERRALVHHRGPDRGAAGPLRSASRQCRRRRRRAQSKLTELASTLVQVEREAASLTSETGPALVAALVRRAAGHAADRAREAIRKLFRKAPASCPTKPARRSNA